MCWIYIGRLVANCVFSTCYKLWVFDISYLKPAFEGNAELTSSRPMACPPAVTFEGSLDDLLAIVDARSSLFECGRARDISHEMSHVISHRMSREISREISHVSDTRVTEFVAPSLGVCVVCGASVDQTPVREDDPTHSCCRNCGASYEPPRMTLAQMHRVKPGERAPLFTVAGVESWRMATGIHSSREENAVGNNVLAELMYYARLYAEKQGHELDDIVRGVLPAAAELYRQNVQAAKLTKRGTDRKKILAALIQKVARERKVAIPNEEISALLQMRSSGLAYGEHFVRSLAAETPSKSKYYYDQASATDTGVSTCASATNTAITCASATNTASACASTGVEATAEAPARKIKRTYCSKIELSPEAKSIIATLVKHHNEPKALSIIRAAEEMLVENIRKGIGATSVPRSQAAACAYIALRKEDPGLSIETFCSAKNGNSYYVRPAAIRPIVDICSPK